MSKRFSDAFLHRPYTLNDLPEQTETLFRDLGRAALKFDQQPGSSSNSSSNSSQASIKSTKTNSRRFSARRLSGRLTGATTPTASTPTPPQPVVAGTSLTWEKGEIGIANTRGCRAYMEDMYAVKLMPVLQLSNGSGQQVKEPLFLDGEQHGAMAMIGVFDGHGGANCSTYVSERINSRLVDTLAKALDGSDSKAVATEDNSVVVGPLDVRRGSKNGALVSVKPDRRGTALFKIAENGKKVSNNPATNTADESPTISEPEAEEQTEEGKAQLNKTITVSAEVVASDERASEALRETFIGLDKDYCKMAEAEGEEEFEDGTTATLLAIWREPTKKGQDPTTARVSAHLAAVGDSRSLVIRVKLSERGTPAFEELNSDHDPIFDTERARVEAAGGRVDYDSETSTYRVHGPLGDSLAVTRSIGDVYFSKFVVADPDIVHWEPQVNDDDVQEIVCVASDGVWGWMENDAVSDVIASHVRGIRKCTCDNGPNETGTERNGDDGGTESSTITEGSELCARCCARDMVTMAYKKGSSDNITVTIVPMAKLVRDLRAF